MTGRRALAIALGLTALAWLPTLRGGFVWDDINNLVHSDRLATWSALGDVFMQPAMWSAGTDAGAVPTWRPLALASFVIDRQVFGHDPAGYHLSSVLWHLLATAAVFTLFARVFGAAGGAPQAGMLRSLVLTLCFSLHPAAAEAVAWINGRSELFALLGGAGALALAISGVTLRRAPAFALLLAVALMAKETGLIFVPLTVAAAARRWPVVVVAALVVPVVLAVRMQAAAPPSLGPSIGELVLALPSVYYRALQATLVPVDLGITTLGPWIAQLSLAERVGHGLLMLGLAAAPVVLWLKGLRHAAVGMAWWLGALLPTAVLVPLGWPGLQRWLCLALPGLLMALGHLPPSRVWRFAIPAVLVLFTLQTQRAIQTWSSEEALYIQTLEEDPTSALALANLGALLLQRGQYAEAEGILVQAIDARPRQDGVRAHLTRSIARQGRCVEARAHLNLDPEQGQGRERAAEAVRACEAGHPQGPTATPAE